MSDVYVVEFSYDYEGSEAKFACLDRGSCFAWIELENQKLNSPDVGFNNRYGDRQIVTKFSPLAAELWTRVSEEDEWTHKLLVDGAWTVQS